MAFVDLTSLPSLFADHIRALTKSYGEVLQKHHLDALVLSTGTPQKKSSYDDQYWPLVGVPHTRHWLPLTVADCAVVIAPGQQPRLLLNTARDFWEGPSQPDSDHFWREFDVIECQGVDAIKALLPQGKRAFVSDVS